MLHSYCKVPGVLPAPTFGGKSIASREIPVIIRSRRAPTLRKQVKSELPFLRPPNHHFRSRAPSTRANMSVTPAMRPPPTLELPATGQSRTLNSSLTPTMGTLNFRPTMTLPALEKDEYPSTFSKCCFSQHVVAFFFEKKISRFCQILLNVWVESATARTVSET